MQRPVEGCYGPGAVVAVLGGGGQRTIYDGLNRPIKTFRLNVTGDSTVYYHGATTLDSLRDAKGQVYAFRYNALGWLTGRKDPATGTWDSLSYDRDGLLRRFKNRRGTGWVNIHYDALHRETAKGGTGTDSVTLAYTAHGAVVTGSSAGSTETIYANVRGQPDSVSTVIGGQTYWRRYAYASSGQLDSLWASGMSNMITRKYNRTTARGTLDSIRLGSARTALRYTNELMQSTKLFPSGDSVMTGYTTVHGAWRTVPPSYHPLYRTYQSDSLGRIGRWADSVFAFSVFDRKEYNRDFVYDLVGRLNETTYGAAIDCSFEDDYGYYCLTVSDSSRTYSYDLVGNLTGTFRVSGDTTYPADTTSFSPAGSNRLSYFRGMTYQYDNDGNVVRRYGNGASDTLWWSAENRLDSVSYTGSRHRYAYDAGGRLVKLRQANGPVRFFLWDGDQLFAEVDSATGDRVAEYSWYPGVDRLHAVLNGTSGPGITPTRI